MREFICYNDPLSPYFISVYITIKQIEEKMLKILQKQFLFLIFYCIRSNLSNVCVICTYIANGRITTEFGGGGGVLSKIVSPTPGLLIYLINCCLSVSEG